MKKLKHKITYGKNVYDKREINAVVKTLKKTTQMSKNVSEFENVIDEVREQFTFGIEFSKSTELLSEEINSNTHSNSEHKIFLPNRLSLGRENSAIE